MNEDQNIINHSEGKYFDGEKSVLNEKELEELKGMPREKRNSKMARWSSL